MRVVARALGRALLGAVLAQAACSYNPQPMDGQQACYSGTDKQACPDGYVCAGNGYCYRHGNVPVFPDGSGGEVTSSGGVVAGRGGSGGSGGVVATTVMGSGGRPATGGVVATGGTGRGGAVTTGGVTGTGGTTTPPNAGTVVTIANGQAQGAMTGFGWIALGSLDTVRDPTCASPAGPIVSGVPCDITQWSSTTAYCMSGNVPVVPPNPTKTDYDNNWGIEIGINATPDGTGALGQSFSSVAVTVSSASDISGLRVSTHRLGDPDGTNYCTSLSSGVQTPFSRFNSACWDNSGTFLSAGDVAKLDKIMVSVPSTPTSAIAVDNLCITGITFAR
jgi:hypothetical protein